MLQDVLVEADRNNAHGGVKAQTKSGIPTLKFPIERGISTMQDGVENIWNHIFYDKL